MSWTNELVLEFVELYRRERILWDPKHPYHRNRSEVTSAWIKIQSSLNLNCTLLDLKRKKESLMTAFRFHYNRKRKTPHYKTSWFAYKPMEAFLCGRYVCDSTNELENEFFDNSDYNTNSQGNNDPILCNNAQEKSNTSFRQPRSKKLKIKSSYRSPTDDNSIYSKETLINDDGQSFDEYDLYGQLLAKKLRKLDEHQRDVAMHEIDNIMFRAKMDGTTQSRNYSTSPSPVPPKMKSPIFIVTQPNTNQYEDENISYQEHIIQTQPPT